jgi:hypothetical protein
MPVVSRFFGIVIYMHWRDHSPPHFHARYQDAEISVDIETGEITGVMGKRAVGLIQEWRLLHKRELLDNWASAIRKEAIQPIPPLE